MPRTRTAVKLTPDQQSKVDALIRRYGYVCFDLVKAELAASGITFSRSALRSTLSRAMGPSAAERVPGEGSPLPGNLTQRA